MNITVIARPQFYMPEMDVRDDQFVGGNAEQLIEFAGRVCYDSFGKGRPSDAFHRNLLAVGHGSVLEHATFSFLVEGVSRNLMAELTRHRAGCAYSVRSTRYVDEQNTPVVRHPLLDELFVERPDLRDMWELADCAARDTYCGVYAALYHKLAKAGVDEVTARKQARGAARGILPSALETTLVWSANIRELRHVIEMRAADAADAEMRLFADMLLEIMADEVPAYFTDYDLEFARDGVGLVVDTEYRKV